MDFEQKYIVWPTPKPKTEFHRALETAFPIYDPLFSKSTKPKESPAMSGDRDEAEDVAVPESWESRDTEGATPAAGTVPINEDDVTLSREPSCDKEESPADRPSTVSFLDEDVVLGPGGQWGLQADRLLPARPANSDATPRVPAWSLPSTNQSWAFSEITHHGRKKPKSLQRKQKKMMDN